MFLFIEISYDELGENKVSKLVGLEPKEPLRFFEELCMIPHGSGNTKAISDYCVSFAEERNLQVIQDDWNNIIIIKEATSGYENEEAVIIQGHLDMVCEKTEDSDFDFLQDSLELETDGEWIWAKNTTLGGDDGIAIAMALAVLDSKKLSHPRIEAVFTVDEEIGLLGAAAIDLSMLTGKKLINIDSEDDTQILTSCAGGIFLEGTIPVSHVTSVGVEYELTLKGLLGGHSGAEIHKGRGNSNVLMGRILFAVSEVVDIVTVNGGNAHNVIPSQTIARVVVSKGYEQAMLKKLAAVIKEIQKEYVIADGGVYLEFKAMDSEIANDVAVLDEKSKMILVNTLMNLPNGIQSMSMAIPGLVETSLNLGVLSMTAEHILLKYNIRSSVESAKYYLGNRTVAMIEMMGGTGQINGDYPGWEYLVYSPLREQVVKVYTKVFGKEPIIGAIHAGLECGLFASKIEDLDCVSIGPNLMEIHSVNERMEVSSAEKIWKLLIMVLEQKG